MSEFQSPSLGKPKGKVTRRGFLIGGAIATAAAWLAACKPLEKVVGYATRPRPQEIIEGVGEPIPIAPQPPDLNMEFVSPLDFVANSLNLLPNNWKEEFLSRNPGINCDHLDNIDNPIRVSLFERIANKIPYKHTLPKQLNEKPYWKAINPEGDDEFSFLRSLKSDRSALLEELLILFGKTHGGYFHRSDFQENGQYAQLLPYEKKYIQGRDIYQYAQGYRNLLEEKINSRVLSAEETQKAFSELDIVKNKLDELIYQYKLFQHYVEWFYASNHDNQYVNWQYPDGKVVDNEYKPGICFSYIAQVLHFLDIFSGDENRVNNSLLVINDKGEFQFRDTLSIMSNDQSLSIKNLEKAIQLRCGREYLDVTGASAEQINKLCGEGYLIVGFKESNYDPSNPYNHAYIVRQVGGGEIPTTLMQADKIGNDQGNLFKPISKDFPDSEWYNSMVSNLRIKITLYAIPI